MRLCLRLVCTYVSKRAPIAVRASVNFLLNVTQIYYKLVASKTNAITNAHFSFSRKHGSLKENKQ